MLSSEPMAIGPYIKLILSSLWLFLWFDASSQKNTSEEQASHELHIGSDFTAVSINDKVLIYRDLPTEDLSQKGWSTYLDTIQAAKWENQRAIWLGDYHEHPDGWFAITLINDQKRPQKVVIDEFNLIRCDAFEVYTLQNGIIKSVSKIDRSTPFAERMIPFYCYSVPIDLPPGEPLKVIIHSTRKYGFHEVNLSVSTYQVFMNKIVTQTAIKAIEMILLVLCVFLMLIMGSIFRDNTMLYLALYLTTILLTVLPLIGLMDTSSLFSKLGVSRSGFEIFAAFLLGATYHPYGMKIMEPVPKNEKWFKGISYTLIAVNLLFAVCYLLPVGLFLKIDRYLPYLMSLFTSFINPFWVLYCSVIALIRSRIVFFFAAIASALVFFLYHQIINVFVENATPLKIKIDQSSFVMAIVAIAIITIFQLRDKLVTRKKHEKNLLQLKDAMENIRKGEIQNIGRNLHDNVGNILASAIGYLNLKKPNIGTSEKLVTEAIHEIRFLSHNLVKDDDMPLFSKLETLVSRFNDFSPISFHFKDYSDQKMNQLDKITQQNIYMIMQEVLTNIIKHSKATEAHIQVFMQEDRSIQFIIEDDGIGSENMSNGSGIGLKNIKRRAELSHLNLSFDSTSSGTNFIIETPPLS